MSFMPPTIIISALRHRPREILDRAKILEGVEGKDADRRRFCEWFLRVGFSESVSEGMLVEISLPHTLFTTGFSRLGEDHAL
jgi:hypothetical protein